MLLIKKPIIHFFVGCIVGYFIHIYSPSLFSEDNKQLEVISNTKDNDAIFFTEKVKSVEKIITNNYYQFSQKTKEEIENGVITSLVESLGDKHSNYFPPKEAKEFADILNGDFEGIGAVIDEHVRGIIIRKVFESSPAKKAGLQDGDIIVKVGDESMLGLHADEAVKKIRGPKGSTVIITYIRGENSTQSSVNIIRDTIIVPSTQERMLTGVLSDIGYIEVAFFGERTTQEFEESLLNLSASGARGIILDFRNNGGGYLDVAVNMLSYLLPENTLAVTTRENDPKKTFPMYTKKNKYTNTSIPIVMLINNLSASATEIVAGALQDYNRAIIIGEQSYGKGSVQEPFLLKDGSIVKLTIAKWYTPKDTNIDKNGITPDILIPLFDRDFTNQYDRQLMNAKEILNAYMSTNSSREDFIKTIKKKDFTQ